MTTQFAFLVYFWQNSVKQLGYFYIFAYLCSDIGHGRILHSLVVGNGPPKLGGLTMVRLSLFLVTTTAASPFVPEFFSLATLTLYPSPNSLSTHAFNSLGVKKR